MANFPLSSFHFKVDWGGTSIDFSEIGGFSLKTDVIEYRGGASKEYATQKVPGLLRNRSLTFSRGVVHGDNEFFEWFNTIQLSTVERRDIILSLLNEMHEPVFIYKVKNAWPSEIRGSKWNALESTFAIETMVVQHEGIIPEHV